MSKSFKRMPLMFWLMLAYSTESFFIHIPTACNGICSIFITRKTSNTVHFVKTDQVINSQITMGTMLPLSISSSGFCLWESIVVFDVDWFVEIESWLSSKSIILIDSRWLSDSVEDDSDSVRCCLEPSILRCNTQVLRRCTYIPWNIYKYKCIPKGQIVNTR